MRNSKKTFFVLLCIAAVAALAVGFVRLHMERTYLETALPADAYLDDIRQVAGEDGSVRTVVTVWYLVDGVEQVAELVGYSPAMKDESGKIQVYYQPDAPDVCYVPGTLGYTSLFWIGGALAAAAVVWAAVKNPFRKEKPAADKPGEE